MFIFESIYIFDFIYKFILILYPFCEFQKCFNKLIDVCLCEFSYYPLNTDKTSFLIHK